MRTFTQLYDYSVNTARTSIYDAGTVRWLATRIQSPRSTLGIAQLYYYYYYTYLPFLPKAKLIHI